ncbi:MAG: tRNA (guanosine(46)-N7)-methyltransferase TrmB [Clostridia bacterium]|nr:tRNA (guanosine(46)-N7)-methyltransferase TrmB [Clostridia bacterium]
MRMRRRRNLPERMEACRDYLFKAKSDNKNMKTSILEKEYFDFSALFQNDNPVVLEIGSGKGYFACELARRHPELNVLAIEMIANVAIIGAEQAKEEALKNVRFFLCRAECITKYIPPHSIGTIYLNFSTPLPKDGYKKQRLTHERFLQLYKEILTPGGVICQKTDSVPFFEFSMEEYKKCGFVLKNVTYDLKEGDLPEHIVTEHEAMFREQGVPICRVEAHLEEI